MKMAWVQLCKRTNDPKLAAIEALLAWEGIKSRRNGESWHAPILEVREKDSGLAWALLSWKDRRWGNKVLDDVRDDSPCWERIIHNRGK